MPRLVHVSHLNASHDSPSEFYKSKARGDDLVREAFPDATIVRPSIMFGYEDRLLNNMARTSAQIPAPSLARSTDASPPFPSHSHPSVADLVEAQPYADQDPPRACEFPPASQRDRLLTPWLGSIGL